MTHKKEQEKLESEHKSMKKRLAQLKFDLKKANELFKTTLEVKLEYEKVLVKLMKSRVSHDFTLKTIEKVQG